jgi:hypothetical protein
MHSLVLGACALVALTVMVHAAGLALLLGILRPLRTRPPRGLWPITRLLLTTMGWLTVIHLAGIALCGVLYMRLGCFPDVETAFYFSGASYTTVGYGDVVLARPWRLLGPLEGLLGMLMCALSTGFLFTVLSHIYQSTPMQPEGAARND